MQFAGSRPSLFPWRIPIAQIHVELMATRLPPPRILTVYKRAKRDDYRQSLLSIGCFQMDTPSLLDCNLQNKCTGSLATIVLLLPCYLSAATPSKLCMRNWKKWILFATNLINKKQKMQNVRKQDLVEKSTSKKYNFSNYRSVIIL